MASSCNGGGIVDAATIHQKRFISILACVLFGVLRESKSNPVNTSNTTECSLNLIPSNYSSWLGDYVFSNNGSIVTMTNETLNQSTCQTILDDVELFNITTIKNEIEITTNIIYSYENTTVGCNQSCICDSNKHGNVTDNELYNVSATTRIQKEAETFKNLVNVQPINSSSQLRDILNINHSKNDYSIILWKNKEMVKIIVKSNAKRLKPYYFSLTQNNNNSHMLHNLIKTLHNIHGKLNDINIASGSNYRNNSETTFSSKRPLKRIKKRDIQQITEIRRNEFMKDLTDKNTSNIDNNKKLNRKSRSNAKNYRSDDEEYNSEGYDLYEAGTDEGLIQKRLDGDENEKEMKPKSSRKIGKSRKKRKRKKSKSKKLVRNIMTPAPAMDNDIIFDGTSEPFPSEDLVEYDESGLQKPSVITKRDQTDNYNNSEILMLIKSFVDNELFPDSNNESPEKKVVIGHDLSDKFKFDEPHTDHASSPVTSPLHFNIYFYNNRDRSDPVKLKNSQFSKTTVAIEQRAIPGDGKEIKQSNVEVDFSDDSPRKTEYSNSRSPGEPQQVIKSGCNLKTIVLSVMIALIVAAVLLIIGYALFKHLKKKVAQCQGDVSECSTCN